MRVGVPRWICREVSAPVGVRRLMSSLGMHFKRALEGRHSQEKVNKSRKITTSTPRRQLESIVDVDTW